MTTLQNPSIDSLITTYLLDDIVEKYQLDISFNDLVRLCRFYGSKGCDMAIVNLGIVYETNGMYTRAAICYSKAAHRNNLDAMVKLANLYTQGYGVRRNYKTAYDWYIKCLPYDNTGFVADCIATLYYTGSDLVVTEETLTRPDYLPRDLKIALHWYALAAQKGNAESMMMLVNLYTNGIGVKRDLTTAMYWHLKSGFIIEPWTLAKYYKLNPDMNILEQLYDHRINGNISKTYLFDVLNDSLKTNSIVDIKF